MNELYLVLNKISLFVNKFSKYSHNVGILCSTNSVVVKEVEILPAAFDTSQIS
jgi:hypothetical protein